MVNSFTLPLKMTNGVWEMPITVNNTLTHTIVDSGSAFIMSSVDPCVKTQQSSQCQNKTDYPMKYGSQSETYTKSRSSIQLGPHYIPAAQYIFGSVKNIVSTIPGNINAPNMYAG